MAAESGAGETPKSQLSSLLDQCENLDEFHAQADADAVRLLQWHNILVLVATVFGYGAVLFAIWQLTGAPWPGALFVGGLEFLFAIATTIAVLSGLWAAVDRRWRLRRFQAEAAKFVKYNFLLNKGTVNSAGKHLDMDKMLSRLAELQPSSVKAWIRGELDVLELENFQVQNSDAEGWTDEELLELEKHYVAHRLEPQRRYFDSGAKWRYRWEHYTKMLAHWCFFVSVIAACAHFWWDEIIKHFFHIEMEPVFGDHAAEGHALDIISFSLLLLAACLPVIGAAMRNFRSANEFGRNENRYCALHNDLTKLARELAKTESPQQKLNCMFRVEEALEYEHRSWQRLMVEAEWFG